MNTCVVIAALIIAVHSGIVPEKERLSNEKDGGAMEYFLVEKSEGVYEVQDLVNAEVDSRASDSDLTYHFFSQEDPTRGTAFRSNNIAVLNSTPFTPSKYTVFLVHGWNGHNESRFTVDVTKALLSSHDVNLIVVDWGPIAGRGYVSARDSVVSVGNLVASLIQSLRTTFGLDLARVAFVGFSLGAHVSGNAGAALSGQVDQIVGLDPAGPLFTSSNINNRLDPTDARFVQIIHTNSGLLGFRGTLGHADFRPNGGSTQPGCGLDLGGSCAHDRAFEYYAESVSSSTNLFTSTRCNSFRNYQDGRCSGNDISVMGGFPVNTAARGDHFLRTRSSAPFALG